MISVYLLSLVGRQIRNDSGFAFYEVYMKDYVSISKNFLNFAKIKRMRKLQNGDSLLIIYLKLLLLGKGGRIEFDGVDADIYEQLSWEIDEPREK